MSFLFGESSPTPAPVPQSPTDSEEAARKRQAAADAALSQQRAAGRAQTVSAGREIAADEQQALGTVNAKRRAASRDIVG